MLSTIRSQSIKAPILSLIALAALISILRLHYYDWPPNRDVTFYAVVSHELLQGKNLYSDVWDIKPPAIFISYGAAEAIFGYGLTAIYILNLICAVAILSGVYTAGAFAGFGAVAGIWAALFWTALSGDLSLQMNDLNTEAFINAFVIWAFALFLLKSDRPFSNGRAVVIGLLFAWASLYKHVVVVIPFALSITHIAWPPAGTSRRQATAHVFIIAAIGVVCWAAVFAYMAMTGRLQIFYHTLITHAFAYAGNTPTNVAGAAASGKLFEGVSRFQVVIPLLSLASIAILYGLIKERSRAWGLIVMYAIGAFICIALPGKFYRHYFQLGVPPLVVAGGWATVILSRYQSKLKASMPHIAAAIVLIFIIGNQVQHFRSLPQDKLAGTYAELYLVTQKLGRKLPSILKPDETFFQWGAESGLYFFSRQRPISSINAWPLLSKTFANNFTRKTQNDLKKELPELVILAKYFIDVNPDHSVLNWIYKNYCMVSGLSETEEKYFILMARCGSALESRMSVVDN